MILGFKRSFAVFAKPKSWKQRRSKEANKSMAGYEELRKLY